MAVAGRKPDPIPLRILKGNPQKKPIPEHVKTEPKLPRVPSWLDARGKREWRRIGKELLKLGLMSNMDFALLASYCDNYSIMIECRQHMAKEGGVVAYLAGRNTQTSMILTTYRASQNYIKSVAAEFGLSPSARGRLEIVAAVEKDKYLDWN